MCLLTRPLIIARPVGQTQNTARHPLNPFAMKLSASDIARLTSWSGSISEKKKKGIYYFKKTAGKENGLREGNHPGKLRDVRGNEPQPAATGPFVARLRVGTINEPRDTSTLPLEGGRRDSAGFRGIGSGSGGR